MGWIGTVFLILGRYYIAEMENIGLLFSFIGDFLWFMVGFRKRMISLAFTGGIMALLDLVGWLLWIK